MNNEAIVTNPNDNSAPPLLPDIAGWVEKVRKGTDDTFDAIMAHAKTVFDAETDLETFGTVERDQFRKESGLSQSMLSKLKQVGKKTPTFILHKDTLPPSLTILYQLTKLKTAELDAILKRDLKGKTRIEIESMVTRMQNSNLFQSGGSSETPSNSLPQVRNLITFTVSKGVDEPKLILLIAEIKAAANNLSKKHQIALTATNVAVDPERKARDLEKSKERENKALVKRIKLETRGKFKKIRLELVRQELKSKAINDEFRTRFGEVYKDALAHSNPLQVYERWPRADHISDAERTIYEKYVPKIDDKAPAQTGKAATDLEQSMFT